MSLSPELRIATRLSAGENEAHIRGMLFAEGSLSKCSFVSEQLESYQV